MRPCFVFVWLRREIKSSERSFGLSVRPLIIIIFLWPYLGTNNIQLGSMGRRLHRVFPKQETCNSVDLCEQVNILSSHTKLPFVLSINSKLPNCWLLCSSTFRSESPFEFRIQSVTFIQSRAESDEENVFSWNPVSLERFTKWGSKGHFAATQFRFILQNLTTNVTRSFFRQNSFLQPISGVLLSLQFMQK